VRDRGKAGDQTFGERAWGGASDVAPVPGRQSLVQLSMAPAEASPEPQPAPAEPSAPMAQLPSYASIRRLLGNRVQAKAAAGPGPADVHAAAAQGISGSSSSLPHLEQIQRSFGRHDVSHVQAHTGTEAKAGARAMGADAFATGDHVAFANSPSLHIAAHVVQQRGGVQLAGGVGAVGDTYEQHADQVADLVVQGKSAEALLDQHAGGGAASAPVQRQQADPGGPAPGHVAEVRAKLATARAILGDKNAPIGEGERKELEVAVRNAEAALLGYDDLAGRGHARAAAMGPLALAGGGILADDATGVGVADDPALIFIGIGILAALLLTQAPASDRQLAQAWSKVAASLKAVAAAGEVLVALRIKGEQLRGKRAPTRCASGSPPRAGERWGHAFRRAAEEEQGQRLALVE